MLGGPLATFDTITGNIVPEALPLSSRHEPFDVSWNALQHLLTSVALCRPLPVLRPEVMVYLAKMYGAWNSAIRMLQQQVLTIEDDLRPARLQVRSGWCCVIRTIMPENPWSVV